MQRFLKSPTRFTAPRTGRFRHPNHSQNRRAPATMLAYGAALEELESTFIRHSQEQNFELLKIFGQSKAEWVKRSEEAEARIHSHFKAQARSLDKQCAKIHKDFGAEQIAHETKAVRLAEQNHNLFYAILEERTERMKLEGKYNVRGALERIVYIAKLEKKVAPSAGVQLGLDKLAQSGEFTEILHREVEARKLCAVDVMNCVGHLYGRVSKRTKGNDDTWSNIIIVRATKFNENERAALVIFLKVQDNWLNRLDWREDSIM